MKKILIFIIILLEIYSLQTNLRLNNSSIKNLKEEENDSDDIIILHTNDVHCGVMDAIGYDGLSLYKKELKKKYKHVILVDVGDHIQGGTIGLLSKGLDIIDIMNKIEYDVAILGNHEFDYGVEQLQVCKEKLECGYISSNYCYRKNKTSIYPAYKIVKRGEKKIAFIGVTTPQTLSKTYLHNIVDENGTMIYDFLTENEGKELYDTIQKYINEVKGEGANYVILLAHVGNEGDAQEKYTSSGILSNINGVDAVLDGHTHKIYSIKSKDKDGKEIHLAPTGTKLTNIGVIKIKSNGEVISELISEIPEPEDKTGAEKVLRKEKERWVDSDMKKILEEKINAHGDKLNEKIGYSNFDLKINLDDSGDAHKQISRSEESTLCDLVADAFRDIGKGEICLVNAGTVRTDLMKGNITYNNILDILPFSSEIIVKKVLGQDILDALEFGMKELPFKTSRFPQVSGISFKVNTSINSTVEIDENEMFIKVSGDRRVFDVKVGNESLDVNKTYIISFDEYIANGGDGYSMFSKYEEIMSTLKADNEAFMIYVKEKLNGTIPDQYRKTQDRIVIYPKEENNKKDENNNNNDGGLNVILIVVIVSILLLFCFIIIFICIRKKRSKNSSDLDLDRGLIAD